MDREESKKIAMLTSACYPNWRPPDMVAQINAFAVMFAEYPYKEVETALTYYVKTDGSGFPPSIGKLIEIINFMKKPDDAIPDLAAWSMVYKAICNSNYNAEEEFNKLPPAIQRAVGNPNNLKEWAAMDTNTVQSVEQSHFLRAYRAEVKREKELEKIPESIREQIGVKNDGNRYVCISDKNG